MSGNAVFRDLFGTEEMRALWDDGALIQGWLDAEAALARAEAAVGVIPAEAAEEIVRKARADAALAQTIELVEGLTVDRDRMRANLGLTGGLILAESVMMRVAERLGRQRAHELLHELAMRSFETGEPFGDLLLADPRLAPVLGAEAVAELLEPSSYLGLAGRSVDAVLARYAAGAGERQS